MSKNQSTVYPAQNPNEYTNWGLNDSNAYKDQKRTNGQPGTGIYAPSGQFSGGRQLTNEEASYMGGTPVTWYANSLKQPGATGQAGAASGQPGATGQVGATSGQPGATGQTANNISTAPAYSLPAPTAPSKYDTFQADYNKNMEQSRQQQIMAAQQLGAASKGQVNQQIAQLPSQYDPMRAQAYQLGVKGGLGDQERLASQGLLRSGERDTTALQRQVATQNQVGQLNQQQAAQQQALANKLLEIDAQTNAGVNTINAKTAEQLASAALQNYWKSQEMSLAERQQGWKEGMDVKNFGLSEAAITGMFQGKSTLAAKSLQLDQDKFDESKAMNVWKQRFKDKSFDYQKERDAVSDTRWGKEYDMALDKMMWDRNEENPAFKAQIIQNNINDILLERMTDPYSQENQMRIAQADILSEQLKQMKEVGPADLALKWAQVAALKSGGGGGGGGGGGSSSAKPTLTTTQWVNDVTKQFGITDEATGNVTYDIKGIADLVTRGVQSGVMNKGTVDTLDALFGLSGQSKSSSFGKQDVQGKWDAFKATLPTVKK